MDAGIVAAAIAEAEESGLAVAELPLERIARRAGVSRATIFRRVRSRSALEAAVREAGVEPGRRARVRERAVAAAAELILAEGVGALTVEAVARRAGCAVTSVHTRFGGRDGLVAAVFERYAPLPVVERVLSEGWGDFEAFEDAVRAVYGAVFDALEADAGVVEALVAEALGKPDGAVMGFVRGRLVPRLVGSIGGWLGAEVRAGRCRDLPLPVLLPLLIAPIGVHLIVRKRLLEAGVAVSEREAVIEMMTGAFCRAVETEGQ